MKNDTEMLTLLLPFLEAQTFEQDLHDTANRFMENAALGPSQVALERICRHIHGHVMALNTGELQDRLDGDAETGQVQIANRLQCLLDVMQPPVVVCVGISVYNLVQELSLPWQPTVIAAQHTIAWGTDYERTLAEQINSLLSTKAT